MITKPMLSMRLLWEGRDSNYDDEDRVRYKRIRSIINRIPYKTFEKLFIKSKSYDTYRGFCYARELVVMLDETEYEIVQSIIENISTGYYKGGNDVRF